MKFLVDECIGPTVAKWLKQKGYDALSIYDEIPGIDDNAVLNKALTQNRVLITCDKDFGEMIFKNKMQHCGILLLRLIDDKPASKINILESILENYRQDLVNNFVVVTEKTVRIIKPSMH